jgi:hypothetical protein
MGVALLGVPCSRWQLANRTAIAALLLAISLVGCRQPIGGDAPFDTKEHLWKLFRLYKAYVERNKKGPPDEQALRDFGAKLTPDERKAHLIGDDIDGLFVSPRDKQKYVIRYNQRLDPVGPMRGIIWEVEGKGGTHLMALSNGYVEEYEETMFKEYSK